MKNVRAEDVVAAVGYAIESSIKITGTDAFDIKLIKAESSNLLVGLGFLVDIEAVDDFEPTQAFGQLTIEIYDCQYDEENKVFIKDGFYRISCDTSENLIYWGDGSLNKSEADINQLKALDDKDAVELHYSQELVARIGRYINFGDKFMDDVVHIAINSVGEVV